jgi:hypothetical protein
LPVLNGKLYIINSPDLIQSAMRNNDISFDPFLIEFSKGMSGLNKRQVEIVARDEVMKDLLDTIHSALRGEPLNRLNIAALTRLMGMLNSIQPTSPLVVSDAFLFIRDHATEATMAALFGEMNPFTAEHLHLLW